MQQFVIWPVLPSFDYTNCHVLVFGEPKYENSGHEAATFSTGKHLPSSDHEARGAATNDNVIIRS